MLPIVGHLFQRAALTRLVKKEGLPATLLFAGAGGIGKRQVARWLAKALLCENHETVEDLLSPCESCRSCTLLRSHNHPDFFEIPCAEKEGGSTEAVRDILHSLSLRSFSGKGRVVLFDNAESLHDAGANALLKTLEEPRPGSYFILITSAPSKMLSTIRSRSQLWSFSPLSEEEMQSALKNPPFSEMKLPREIVTLADGAPGNIAPLSEHLPEWEEIRETLSRIARGEVVAAYELASSLAKEKGALRAKVSMIRSFIRSKMKRAPQDAAWAFALSNLLEAERLIFERNLQPTPALLSTFLSLIPLGPSFTPTTNGGTLLRDFPI